MISDFDTNNTKEIELGSQMIFYVLSFERNFVFKMCPPHSFEYIELLTGKNLAN